MRRVWQMERRPVRSRLTMSSARMRSAVAHAATHSPSSVCPSETGPFHDAAEMVPMRARDDVRFCSNGLLHARRRTPTNPCFEKTIDTYF